MIRYKRALVVSRAVFTTTSIAVANADAPTITGFPNGIRKVDLAGYKLVTSYRLGANTGFTFEQTYLPGGKVSAHGLLPTGQVFISNYVAMPVGNNQLMVTWYVDNGTLNDVFVMNFRTGVVSDVAPEPSPPSLGTVTIVQEGASTIPPP
jgi:hypothetical protein